MFDFILSSKKANHSKNLFRFFCNKKVLFNIPFQSKKHFSQLYKIKTFSNFLFAQNCWSN